MHPRLRPGKVRTSLAVGAICVLGTAAVAAAIVPGTVAGALTPLTNALLPGLDSPAAYGLTDNGAVPSGQEIGVELSLKLPDQNAVTAYERSVADPGSPDYHHFLTPAAYAARFGVADSTYSAARSFLTGHGLSLVSASEGHDVLYAKGPASAVEATFATPLRTFTTSRGTHFYANTAAPMVPSSLPLIGVFGLENWHRAHLDKTALKPAQRPAQDSCTAGVCMGATTPQDMWGVYDQPGTATGVGQKVGIFGEGAYNYVIGDLNTAETMFKLPQRTVKNGGVAVKLADGPDTGSNYTDMGGDVEWQIDTQSSTGMAYNADQLDMYWGVSLDDPDTMQVLSTFVNDATGPSQASASYGECEAQVGDPGGLPIPSVGDPTGPGLVYVGNPYESVAYEQSYEKLLSQGITEGKTLFTSSGDNGSSCGALPVDLNGVTNADGPNMVDYPASSPQVVAVGGTVTYTDGGAENTPATTTQRVDEYGWTDSGGGPSALFPEPSYQDVVPAVDLPCLGDTDGTPDPGSTVCRGEPDISAQSGDLLGNGYDIYADGSAAGEGGTSLSSPMSAGMWTRIQSGTGGNLGYANLTFYKLCNDFFDVGAIGGADTMPSDNGTDVTYPTDTGWDYVTGLGTPDVAKLITDINAKTAQQTCTAGTLPGIGGLFGGGSTATPTGSSAAPTGSSAAPTGSAGPSGSASPSPTGSSPTPIGPAPSAGATTTPAPGTGGRPAPGAAAVTGFHPLGYASLGGATVNKAGKTFALAGHGGIPTAGVTGVLTQITVDKATAAGQVTTTAGRVVAAATKGATTRTLALLPVGSAVPFKVSTGTARVTLAAVGYNGPKAGDTFTPARLGRDSATVTPISTSKKDLVVTVAGKSGIPAKSLDAAVLLLRVTGATAPGTLSATLNGTSTRLAVASYAGARANTDVVVVARPDSHGQVHLRLSAGSAKIVVDQLGGYVKGTAAQKLYPLGGAGQAALGGTVGTASRSLRLSGGSTAVPASAGQVLALVTLRNPTADGELLLAGSREGQVSVVAGVTTTVLLPISLRGGVARVQLSKGRAGISVVEVGYTS